VERCFRVGAGRKKTFVAGLSMGGYGALKYALTFPDRFAAVGAFSGSLDLRFRLDQAAEGELEERIARDVRLAFGDPPRLRPEDDLVELAKRAAGRADLPAIYIACGSEDFLFDGNEHYHETLTELGIEHDYTVEPGIHEWGFWDRHIERFLRYCADRKLL
ncbi:MAG: esterase family protein, partial [Spirochaetaceae bacterium]